MTSLGFPGPFRVFVGPFRPETPETDWDDKPELPKLVIPVRFGFSWPKKGGKTRKRNGMTSLGSPGVSSQQGFLTEKGRENPKRTGMTGLGSPDVSSQSVSGFSSRKGGGKPGSGLGSQALGTTSVSSQSCSFRCCRKWLGKPRN